MFRPVGRGILLSAVLVGLALCGAPATGADLVISYSKQSKNSSLNIVFSSGSSYGYGYGYGHGYGGFGSSYGFGGSSLFVVNGGSFSSFNGYLLPGVAYSSPFYGGVVTGGGYAPYGVSSYYTDPLGFGYSRRPSRTRRDPGPSYDAESIRRAYYGVEGSDSPIPGGGEGPIAARLAQTESVRAGLQHFREGRYVEATLALREAYLRNTRDAGVKIFYGLSLVPLGEYAMAEKAIRRGIEEAEPGTDWLVEVPRLYGNSKDLATHKLLLAHRKDKSDPRHAAFLLAFYLAAEGRGSEARTLLDLLETDGGRAVALLRTRVEALTGE